VGDLENILRIHRSVSGVGRKSREVSVGAREGSKGIAADTSKRERQSNPPNVKGVPSGDINGREEEA